MVHPGGRGRGLEASLDPCQWLLRGGWERDLSMGSLDSCHLHPMLLIGVIRVLSTATYAETAMFASVHILDSQSGKHSYPFTEREHYPRRDCAPSCPATPRDHAQQRNAQPSPSGLPLTPLIPRCFEARRVNCRDRRSGEYCRLDK